MINTLTKNIIDEKNGAILKIPVTKLKKLRIQQKIVNLSKSFMDCSIILFYYVTISRTTNLQGE